MSADCLYHVPAGLIIVPDVSCVTSFTSTEIKDSSDVQKSLAVSAEVSGSGWGAEFSASAEYKKETNEMQSSEKVFVNSEAKCDYYFAQLDEIRPPALTKSFIKMVKSLKTDKDYFRFFEYYGTHFMTQIIFGARFVYKNEITKSDYSELSKEQYSVSVQASYSGAFSLSGKVSSDGQKSKAVTKFRSKSTTTTISVGAPPPASSKATDWATNVKDTPVPTRYKFESIENLFTETYMKNTGIDYAKINKKIKAVKGKYCANLKHKGIVNSCKAVESYTIFKNLGLTSLTSYAVIKADYSACLRYCLEEKKCIAIFHDKGTKCILHNAGPKKTKKEKEDRKLIAIKSTGKVVLMISGISQLPYNFGISNVYLTAETRGIYQNLIETSCVKKCQQDPRCSAVATSRNPKKTECRLYQRSAIVKDSIKFRLHNGFNLKFVNVRNGTSI